MIWKSSGSDAATGCTFFAAFLYARTGAGSSGGTCLKVAPCVAVGM